MSRWGAPASMMSSASTDGLIAEERQLSLTPEDPKR
jgi:hypothetical protein